VTGGRLDILWCKGREGTSRVDVEDGGRLGCTIHLGEEVLLVFVFAAQSPQTEGRPSIAELVPEGVAAGEL
jgi:hypothetical protein